MSLGIALALVLHVSASAQSGTGDVKGLLRRQTQEMLDAITSGSRDVWDRYLDPSVSYVTEDGVLKTRKEMLDNIRPLPKEISGDIRIIEFRVTAQGEVAVATHIDDEHEIFHGGRLHCQYLTTDTWKRTGSGWRIIGSQVMALRTDPPAVALAASVPSSLKADRFTKRRRYQEARVPRYWCVDADERRVEVWTPEDDFPKLERERLSWHPAGAEAPFVLELSELFRAV